MLGNKQCLLIIFLSLSVKVQGPNNVNCPCFEADPDSSLGENFASSASVPSANFSSYTVMSH